MPPGQSCFVPNSSEPLACGHARYSLWRWGIKKHTAVEKFARRRAVNIVNVGLVCRGEENKELLCVLTVKGFGFLKMTEG